MIISRNDFLMNWMERISKGEKWMAEPFFAFICRFMYP
jgi:hypothetical protein